MKCGTVVIVKEGVFMGRNQGFTLVELIAIIVVIAVIALTTIPAIRSSLKRSEERTYESQVKLIEEAALGYFTEHPELLEQSSPNVSILNKISLAELKRKKLVQTQKVINPKTGEPMNGCVGISYDSYKQYKATYYESACGSIY